MTHVPKVRLAYLDNLKALMIIFVVMMHAAVTYSMIAIWYYKEAAVIGNFSFYTFLLYQSLTQAYFMSLLFLISGYFLPPSLERKGTKQFIKDRFFRLGIPLLIYIFLINPLCMKMTDPQLSFFKIYHDGISSLMFLEWTGPMWFVETLLIFALFYLLIKKWVDKLNRFSIGLTTINIFWFITLLTLSTFVIRIFSPIGFSELNLQLGNFAPYIFLFLLGTIAYPQIIFDRIDYAMAKKWLYLAFGLGGPVWIYLVYFGITRDANGLGMSFTGKGGLNFISLLCAFWESFFCVAIIIAFIGIFKERFNRQNPFQKFLSENCFGVYVFHPPILIGTSILLKNMTITPLAKWLIVSAIALTLTYIFASLIRKIPLGRKLFS